MARAQDEMATRAATPADAPAATSRRGFLSRLLAAGAALGAALAGLRHGRRGPVEVPLGEADLHAPHDLAG